MQTGTIDLRTDKILAACLSVKRQVSGLAFDYAAGDRIPPHEHSKAQLIYAIEGTMTVATREGHWVLLPTRAVWVPAYTRHSIRIRSTLRMRTVFFDETVPPPSPNCAVVRVSPLLRELILGMLQEPRSYPLNGRAALMAALICNELPIAQALPMHLPWPKEPRLLKTCNAMRQRPNLGGDMEFWAARVSISSRTLARLFRAELNMSFQEWRAQLLLLEAQIRLAQGQSSSSVAKNLSYDSHAAFSSMFRKALGMAPSEYKKALTMP
jgi:AraC-like DNA-binding protein/quercetin dioxygenase-like cupin family protein